MFFYAKFGLDKTEVCWGGMSFLFVFFLKLSNPSSKRGNVISLPNFDLKPISVLNKSFSHFSHFGVN